MTHTKNLHDATLLSVHFDWVARLVHCELRPVSDNSQTLNLFFEGVRDAHIPAMYPWGKSGSVNTVSQRKQVDGVEFNIEMQSGDVIRIIANRMELNVG
jgi:hypothetical protein